MNGWEAEEACAEAGEEDPGLGCCVVWLGGGVGRGRGHDVGACGEELDGGDEDVGPGGEGEGVVREEVGCYGWGLRWRESAKRQGGAMRNVPLRCGCVRVAMVDAL